MVYMVITTLVLRLCPWGQINPRVSYIIYIYYGSLKEQLPYTVEPPKTDSPYYGNLHNVDKSPQSQIV